MKYHSEGVTVILILCPPRSQLYVKIISITHHNHRQLWGGVLKGQPVKEKLIYCQSLSSLVTEGTQTPHSCT